MDRTDNGDNVNQEPGFFSWQNLRSLGVIVAIIVAVRWSVVSPYYVPTPSMEPTIKVGDRLLANKLAYGLKIPFTEWTPLRWGHVQRGDIIVFHSTTDSRDLVKRVVGVAGDRLRIVDDVLYINDQAMERLDFNHERAILRDITDEPEQRFLYKENLMGLDHWVMQKPHELRSVDYTNWPAHGDMVVPADSVFAMGDNRDSSSDSRDWGRVPLENIEGKATFILWSAYIPQENLLPSFRWGRFGQWLDGDSELKGSAQRPDTAVSKP